MMNEKLRRSLREVRSSLSSQESSANQSILMYHSTLSTPKTAGKAPAPSPHTAVQTEGTLSFHKVEDENPWGIAADPTVPLKVESVLKCGARAAPRSGRRVTLSITIHPQLAMVRSTEPPMV